MFCRLWYVILVIYVRCYGGTSFPSTMYDMYDRLLSELESELIDYLSAWIGRSLEELLLVG